MRLSRLITSAAAAAGVLLLTPAATCAGGGWEPPMRLGVEIPASRIELTARPAPSGKRECQKWRTLASRLGETYAASQIRRTVVARACVFAEPDSPREPVWSWPWNEAGEIDPRLPPRLHASYGNWSIHCGPAGKRERCALTHESLLATDATGTGEVAHYSTHFVIDTIVGEKRLIWRLLGPVSLEMPASMEPGSRPKGKVLATLGGQTREAPFMKCTRAGCLMEANVKLSAEAATHLWDGRPLTLALTTRPEQMLEVVLPSRGFRAALKELSRLKQQEERHYFADRR